MHVYIVEHKDERKWVACFDVLGNVVVTANRKRAGQWRESMESEHPGHKYRVAKYTRQRT